MDERRVFVALVSAFGTRRTDPVRRVSPVGPDGGCWEHAWHTAVEKGWRYVEGSCILRGDIFVMAHAWCEEDTAAGVVVHELTEGYEDAVEYVGLTVPTTGVAADSTSHWGATRASVIEALIVAGCTMPGVLSIVGAH